MAQIQLVEEWDSSDADTSKKLLVQKMYCLVTPGLLCDIYEYVLQ